jgi:hypothetical protein
MGDLLLGKTRVNCARSTRGQQFPLMAAISYRSPGPSVPNNRPPPMSIGLGSACRTRRRSGSDDDLWVFFTGLIALASTKPAISLPSRFANHSASFCVNINQAKTRPKARSATHRPRPDGRRSPAAKDAQKDRQGGRRAQRRPINGYSLDIRARLGIGDGDRLAPVGKGPRPH